jgi:HEAT repeats
VRETAARVLGEIGPEAEAASQELKKLVSDSNSGVRTEAAIALWRIDEDRDALPVLISELEKTDVYEDRKTIIAALGEMGPLAKPALPAIRNVIDPQQRRGVVWGRMIVLPTQPRRRTSYVPTLEEIANEALHRIDPQKQVAFLIACSMKFRGC